MNRLLFLFLLFSSAANAQLSVAADYDRRSEGDIAFATHFYSKAKSDPRVLDFYGASASLETNRFIFSFGLSLSAVKKATLRYSESKYSGGGSSPTYIHSELYSQQIDFSGTLIKIGMEYSFSGKSLLFPELDTRLSLGVLIQCDVTHKFRYDEAYYRHSDYNNNNPDQEMELILDESYFITTPIVKKQQVMSFGFQLNKRWMYKSVFFNVGLSAGWMSKRRFAYTIADTSSSYGFEAGDNYGYYFTENSYDPKRHFYLKSGISVGYIFKMKPNKAQDQRLQDDPELRPGI